MGILVRCGVDYWIVVVVGMSMITKYTSDGKKVLVVGKLNAEQTIVQEIFVSNGQEIPSGENFVVKGLHDAPVESWKEKHLRELEERYDNDRKKFDREIEEQWKRYSVAKDKAKMQADALLAFANNSNSSQIETLKAFISGEITHAFVNDYSPEIIDLRNDNKAYQTDSWGGRIKVEGIKLLSVVGSSGGDLSYRISTYRDGSGGSAEIFPAKSYSEALKIAQDAFDKLATLYLDGAMQGISLSKWEAIDGLAIPSEVKSKYEQVIKSDREKRISRLKDEIAKLEAEQ